MKTNKHRVHGLPVAAILVLLIGLVMSGLAFTAAPAAAAAPMAAGDSNEINWTSLELCAAMGPDNCEATEDTWTFTAPADGTVSVDFEAVSTNTGPDRNEVVDYSTSNGHSGRLGTVPPLPNTAHVTYDVVEGEQISATFTHAPKEPGRKGGSLKVHVGGQFEPTPPPVEPACTGWSVTPASGYAPLQVVGSGSYTDPDGLVESVRVIWGDGNVTTDPNDLGSVPHSYEVGTFTSQLVLVKADGGLVTGDACRASVQAIEPPVEIFEVEVGASCQDHVLSGWVRGYASQEATLNVTAAALGAEIGGTRQVGPGSFEFAADKSGVEGLIAVEATATLTYQGEVVDQVQFSETLDCGLPPLPKPGQCLSASVSVTNVPIEGQWVSVTATGVGINAYVEVDGSIVGGPVAVENGQAIFNVFVKPGNRVSVLFEGEDGLVHSSPACQITIAAIQLPICNDGPGRIDVVVFWDLNQNGFLDEGEPQVAGDQWGVQLQTATLAYMQLHEVPVLPEWTTAVPGWVLKGVNAMHPDLGVAQATQTRVWVPDRSNVDGLDPWHFYPRGGQHGYWRTFASLNRQQEVQVRPCDDIVLSHGLVPGQTIVAVETAAEAAAEPIYELNADGLYTVRAGDVLSNIATAFGQSWHDVAEWNDLTIESGNRVVLSVGQELVLTPPAG